MNEFPLSPLEAIADLAEIVLPGVPLTSPPVEVDVSVRVETSPTVSAEVRLSGKLGKG